MSVQVFQPTPDMPQPLGQVSWLRWIRVNFFKDLFSCVLTVCGLIFIYKITGPLLSWFIFDAVYVVTM